MTDEMIVELYWQRDENAIVQTKNKYETYLYTIAHRILRVHQDSEESVNDTYAGAWNTMPPKKPQVLKTYLGKITRNLSLKRVRDNTAQKRGSGEVQTALDELAEVLSDNILPEEQVEEKLLAEQIRGFLSEAAPRDRAIFLMRYWYLYSVKEIAHRCGFTQSKVKMSLKRSRDKLRDTLQKEGWL